MRLQPSLLVISEQSFGRGPAVRLLVEFPEAVIFFNSFISEMKFILILTVDFIYDLFIFFILLDISVCHRHCQLAD